MQINLWVVRLWVLLWTLLWSASVTPALWAGTTQAHGDAGASSTERQTSAGKASFACGKAASAVEKWICADPQLAAADGALGELYQRTLRTTGDKERLKSQQLAWLKQVRNLCSSAACLQNAYQQRMQALSEPGTVAAAGPGTPFPAVYVGGFTGKETLTFSADGVLLVDGAKAGRYQSDNASPWPEARYPLLLIQEEKGKQEERHCKVQPDLRQLICDDGGTLAAEYVRQGIPPAVAPAPASRCDEEQLYLDVMAAARKARPEWELKGSTSVEQDKPGHCLISLYFLHNGKAIDLPASYDLQVRPVVLHFKK
jgi:uncharacterized protein YecT (DUF1311 family)